MCLLANASAGLPALPAGYDVNVRNGTPISSPDWQTIGIATLDDVRAGFPRIAAFDLTSDRLPPPASLAGNNQHCVLALVHHADDPYLSTQTNTDTNSRAERKAAHKSMTVVEFAGTVPEWAPIVLPVRIHNPDRKEPLVADLAIGLGGYSGRVRLLSAGPRRQAGDSHRRASQRRQSRRFPAMGTIPTWPHQARKEEGAALSPAMGATAHSGHR
jgi:hypothetical protein